MIYIACAIDDNYTQHLGVMLCSMRKTNPNLQAKIFILHTGLLRTNQIQLGEFIETLKFEYTFLLVDTKSIKNAPVSNHITLSSYLRIFLPLVLPLKLNKVLFIDSDIIINADISDLWSIDVKKFAFAAAADPMQQYRKSILGIGLKYTYVNAGVLIVNLEFWRENKITPKLCKFIQCNAEMLTLHDQDTLNAVLSKHILIINNQWNALRQFFMYSEEKLKIDKEYQLSVISNPKIIHYTTKKKPWHLEDLHPLKNKYRENLKYTPWKKYSYFYNLLSRYPNKTHIYESVSKYIRNLISF